MSQCPLKLAPFDPQTLAKIVLAPVAETGYPLERDRAYIEIINHLALLDPDLIKEIDNSSILALTIIGCFESIFLETLAYGEKGNFALSEDVEIDLEFSEDAEEDEENIIYFGRIKNDSEDKGFILAEDKGPWREEDKGFLCDVMPDFEIAYTKNLTDFKNYLPVVFSFFSAFYQTYKTCAGDEEKMTKSFQQQGWPAMQAQLITESLIEAKIFLDKQQAELDQGTSNMFYTLAVQMALYKLSLESGFDPVLFKPRPAGSQPVEPHI